MTTTTADPRPAHPDPGERVSTLLGRLTGDEKHEPAALSTLDVLRVLYERLLRVDPTRPDDPRRDRLLLSKGHGPQAYYAVLAARGFLPEEWLAGWTGWDSPLGEHPDRTLVPGAEISSGSLGHGLPLGVGTALGLRAQGVPARVVVLVGDAELDEGSNAEAAALAGALGLARLTVVAIDNRSATHGAPGRIAARFAVEGWATAEVDGRDHDALEVALRDRPAAEDPRPRLVLARVEAKGGHA